MNTTCDIEILCIGHAAYDIVLPLEDYPAENSKAEIPGLMTSSGGPAANAAHLLASWGVDCAFSGVVGDDHYGREILQDFEQARIDTSLTHCRRNHSTNLSIILVNQQNGSRTIINRKSPAQPLSLDLNDLNEVNPQILLFDGHELEASLAALERFPNAISILDAGSLREGTERLAREVDYLAASERFAKQICLLDELESEENRRKCMQQLHQGKTQPVIVTLGEKGLIYGDENSHQHLPACPVDPIDTTAAGDLFHGALAYGILKKMALVRALTFASIAAALSTTKSGGRASIPKISQVREKLNAYET